MALHLWRLERSILSLERFEDDSPFLFSGGKCERLEESCDLLTCGWSVGCFVCDHSRNYGAIVRGHSLIEMLSSVVLTLTAV